MAQRIAVTKRRLLLVEGVDEQRFFKAAFDHLLISDTQVVAVGGKLQFADMFQALINDVAFEAVEAIGIVRDADATIEGAQVTAAGRTLASVAEVLGRFNLPRASAHAVFVAGPPKTGLFIMPDGTDDGMIETLCERSISSSPSFECIDSFIECLGRHESPPKNLAKARVFSWLATREEPGKRLGEAAQAGYWPFDSPVFSPLWAFLRDLSGTPGDSQPP